MQNNLEKYQFLLTNLNNINSEQETDRILEDLVKTSTEILNASQVVIVLYDYVINGLRILSDSICSQDSYQEKMIEIDESFFGNAYFSEGVSIILDVQNDEKFNKNIDGQLILTQGIKSVIATQMLSPKQKKLGVVAATFDHEIDIDDQELQLILKLISQQAAIIISKEKMYQDMEQTLDNIANFEQMKTAFIAITSHELRTPLGVIIGYATYLQNLVSQENKEFVDAILNSAVRLKEIIEDTRTLKNFQNDQATVHLKNSKINLLLEDVVKANSFLAYNENIKISTNFPPNDVKANVDKEKFTTAMDHIIRNALLFNKQNGIVKVILEEDDNFFTVSILDNGIGIPEEDLEKIFDRFYQVSSHLTRNIGGMGLGLSISKSIIDMHHGQISVQSVLGRGSRFIVMMPKNPEVLEKNNKKG